MLISLIAPLYGFSLFFMEKEAPDPVPERALQEIRVDGIMYFDADRWTIWINGQAVRSQDIDAFEGLKIRSVTPTKVDFSYHQRSFSLNANQSASLEVPMDRVSSHKNESDGVL